MVSLGQCSALTYIWSLPLKDATWRWLLSGPWDVGRLTRECWGLSWDQRSQISSWALGFGEEVGIEYIYRENLSQMSLLVLGVIPRRRRREKQGIKVLTDMRNAIRPEVPPPLSTTRPPSGSWGRKEAQVTRAQLGRKAPFSSFVSNRGRLGTYSSPHHKTEKNIGHVR